MVIAGRGGVVSICNALIRKKPTSSKVDVINWVYGWHVTTLRVLVGSGNRTYQWKAYPLLVLVVYNVVGLFERRRVKNGITQPHPHQKPNVLRHITSQWRQNYVKLKTKNLIIFIFQGLQYDILLDVVQLILRWGQFRGQIRPWALTPKVNADRRQKLISWAPLDLLCFGRVWRRSHENCRKIKGFVDLCVQCDLDLDLCHFFKRVSYSERSHGPLLTCQYKS